MSCIVEIRHVPAQALATVRGTSTIDSFPVNIRTLFNAFYANFKGKGGHNVVSYSACDSSGIFEIECGVQVETGGNSSTPAGIVATTAYLGSYSNLSVAHNAIHHWVKDHHRKLAGPSWEVYGHWTDDPAQLRTDVFYLLAD